MIEPRIYRAAFLPALLALVLVAFSLESPPHPVAQGLAADALFEGTTAISTVRDIASTTPDRRVGRPGDDAVASRVKQAFVSHGFATTVDRFTENGTSLVNVVGRRPGDSSKQIVVLAARDAASVPDEAGSAADTAALIEFARVFEGRASNKTIVLASVDGSQLGDAGARHFADTIGSPSDVEAVIVLSNLGASRSSGPLVLGWSNDEERGNVGLERTVNGSLREELGSVPHADGAFAQFARLTFPVAPGAQGVLLPAGLDAVRVSGSGELRPSNGGAHVAVLRYGSLGRAALRLVSSLDASAEAPVHGPKSYVQLAGKLMPSGPLQVLAFALLLPVLITSVDALARARRRREPVLPWLFWLATAVAPLLVGLALALFLVVVGLATNAPPAPLDPRSVHVDAADASTIAASLLAVALTWVLLRTSVLRRGSASPDASAPGAACMVSLALSVFVLALAFVNPFAALLLVPALHLWMLGTLTDASWRTGLVLFLLGLLPVALVVLFYLFRFGLGPIDAVWYLFALVTGGALGVWTTACCIALLALTGSLAAIVFARARHGDPVVDGPGGGGGPRRRRRGASEEPRPSIFGPGGHAGPGAIGQARSTLGR